MRWDRCDDGDYDCNPVSSSSSSATRSAEEGDQYDHAVETRSACRCPASLRALLLLALLRVNRPIAGVIGGIGDRSERHSLKELRATLRPASLSDLSKFLKDLGSQIVRSRDRLTSLCDLTSGSSSEFSADIEEVAFSVDESLSVATTLLARVCVCLEVPANLVAIDDLPPIARVNLDASIILKNHRTCSDWMVDALGFGDIVWIRSNQAENNFRSNRGGEVDGSGPTSQKILRQKLRLESARQELALGQLIIDFLEFRINRPRSRKTVANSGRAGGQQRAFGQNAALAAVVWDNRALTHSLETSYLQELTSVEQDLTVLRDIQQQLATEVHTQQAPLDTTEEHVCQSTMFTRQANNELLAAAGNQAQNWTLSVGAFFAVVGGVAGLVGGAPGAAIGASVGGALGGTAGRLLKKRRQQQLRTLRSNLHGSPRLVAASTSDSPSHRSRTGTALFSGAGSLGLGLVAAGPAASGISGSSSTSAPAAGMTRSGEPSRLSTEGGPGRGHGGRPTFADGSSAPAAGNAHVFRRRMPGMGGMPVGGIGGFGR